MSRRDRVALAMIGAGVALAALCLGGAPRWAALLAATCGIAATLPYATSRRKLAERSPLLLLIAAAALLTAFQLLPLPAVMVGVLSPEKLAAVTANAAALEHATPGWLSLSMDPPRTAVELAKLAGYLGLAWAALRIARGQAGVRALAAVVAGIGAVIAVITIAHELAGTSAVFGIYEPRTAEHMPLTSPIINSNHLAGLMVLAAPVALALAASSAGRLRVLWIAAVVACCAIGVLSASRGGVVALGLGMVACAALLFWGRRKRRHRHGKRKTAASARASVAITVACALVLGLTLTGEMAWNQLTATRKAEILAQEGKLAVWKEVVGLVPDYPWVGVGRGGFESAFSAEMSRGDKVFSHVENVLLQVVMDWGLPAALLFAVLLGAAVLVVVRRWRGDPLDAGLAAGFVALVVHNLVDFSLAMPGVAMPAVVAAAALSRGSLARISRPQIQRTMGARLALVGGAAVALMLAATPWARSARADNLRLAARQFQDPRAALAAATDILDRHPADHVAAGRVAEALFALRDPRAVPMINRALALNPGHPGLHLVAARMLIASQDPHQALVQYRLAIARADRRAAWPLIAEVLGHFSDPATAARGFPSEGLWLRYVNNRLRSADEIDVAIAFVRRATVREPARAEGWTLLSRLLRRQHDLEGAIFAGRRALDAGGDAHAALALAAAQREAENPAAAAEVARRALEKPVTGRNRIRLHLALAAAQAAAGNLRAAHRTLLVTRDLCGTDRRMAEITARRIDRIEAEMHATKHPEIPEIE